MIEIYCEGQCPDCGCGCGRGKSSPSNFEMIRDEFHPAFGTVDPQTPTVPDDDVLELRAKLIFEEFKELMEQLGFELVVAYKGQPLYKSKFNVQLERDPSFEKYDLKKIAKESADLKVVTYGTDASLGIDADVAFNAVHRSNMTKLGADGKPIRNGLGKILKGPNYKEPDMSIIFGEPIATPP